MKTDRDRRTAARFCDRCNWRLPERGPDPCLGHLPDVLYACCGHGIDDPYVVIAPDGMTQDVVSEFRNKVGTLGRPRKVRAGPRLTVFWW